MALFAAIQLPFGTWTEFSPLNLGGSAWIAEHLKGSLGFMISWSDVIAIAPELVDFDVTGQNLILAWVNEAFDRKMFTTNQLKLARIYLAAHLATVSSQGGDMTAGPVISESVGGISRTYANMMMSGSFSGSTYADALSLLLKTSSARLPRIY